MKCILDLDTEELQTYFQSIQQPTFRCKQVWQGLYHSHFDAWDQFTVLPQTLRQKLAQEFIISPLQVIGSLESPDGSTQKVLFQLPGGDTLETVLMYSNQRISICISSQSGCPVGCKFCATGRLGLKQHLSSGEMLAQILFFTRALNADQRTITNVVIMGMGEPFLNYENVRKAVMIMNDHAGLNLGARRITLSTIGIPEKVIQFGRDFSQVNLAISLHAPTNKQRDELIPINKKFPIEMLMESVKEYIALTNRRVTFEYVMISGFNDSRKDAEQLGSLLQGLLCHVNLIPLNPTPHFPHTAPSASAIKSFQKILHEHGIPATIRMSKGTQIRAGCGQLAGKLS